MAADNEQHLQDVVNTNLMGALYCANAAYKLMTKNDDYGHIINVNSIMGHYVAKFGDECNVNVYASTKYALTAATEVMRQELNFFKNKKVKVSVRFYFV